jgi:hypothetical protein
MKKCNDVAIIGCSIASLYAAIKCGELGYNVCIYERKKSILPITDSAYHNFKLFNDNHFLYKDLLNRYGIVADRIENLKRNQELDEFMKDVIKMSKTLPHNILISQTLTQICYHLNVGERLRKINSSIGSDVFDCIFNSISANDCLDMFINDFSDDVMYYTLSNTSIENLITKMLQDFQKRENNKIYYDTHIKHFKYIDKKFLLQSSNLLQSSKLLQSSNLLQSSKLLQSSNLSSDLVQSDFLITTISKSNLSAFSFWNSDQLNNLNKVSVIKASIIPIIVNNIMHMPKSLYNINQVLLNELHIVYPIFTDKLKYIHLFNIGVNNVVISEKIKHMYNSKCLICSESYSRNNMFIHYSLDYIEKSLTKMLFSYR